MFWLETPHSSPDCFIWKTTNKLIKMVNVRQSIQTNLTKQRTIRNRNDGEVVRPKFIQSITAYIHVTSAFMSVRRIRDLDSDRP